MDTKNYETLIRVLEYGSLTKAAESLGCTQSSISHIINNIESEFGFPILKRNRSGIKLTPDGEKIMPAIRALLLSKEQLFQTVSSIKGLNVGSVRIGTISSVAVHWLPGIIKEFESKFPDIELKLLNGDYYDVEQWISDGSIDIGFLALPTTVNCNCTPLIEDRLLAVLPEKHRLASMDTVPLVELKNEDFIGLLSASDQDARRALESVGIKPNVKYKTKDDYAIISMVSVGLGISIMPELLLQGHQNDVVTRPLFPAVQRVIGLAIPNNSELSPAVKVFTDHVKNWVRQNYGLRN